MHLSKCFSVLLVSGQGAKCSELKAALHQTLLVREPKDSRTRVLKHKFDKVSDPEGHRNLSKLLAKRVLPIMAGIDKNFFGIDLQKQAQSGLKTPFGGSITELSDKVPITLDPRNEKHLLIFRRLLELSMARGLWAGAVGHD